MILGSGIGIAPADGETIGRRIRINQPDDENVRCKVSGVSVQHKDFSPFTQQPTTRSTFNAISFQQGRIELFELRPWTHGVRPLLQHEHDHQRDHSRLSFDNVTKPFWRLSQSGVFEAFFETLAQMSETAHLVQMFDSTIVRAHVPVAGAKGGKNAKRLGARAARSELIQ